jgi:peroxin-7
VLSPPPHPDRDSALSSLFEFRIQNFSGYAVKYSLVFDSHITVAAAANFGLVGNGRLYVLGLTPGGII